MDMTLQSIFILVAVAGATELLKRLKDKDYWAALTIAVAACIGAVAGVFHIEGVSSIATGIVLGLGASGLVVVSQNSGKK